MQTIIAFEGEY